MNVNSEKESANYVVHATRTGFALTLLAASILYLLHGLFDYSIENPLSGWTGFNLLQSWRIPPFYDLRWILANMQCQVPIEVLANSTEKCNGFPWADYPPLSIYLGKALRLSLKDASWIGTASGITLITTICLQTWFATNTVRSWALLTSIALFSFPTQLLIERGNLDTQIYILLSLFCILVWLRLRSGSAITGVLGSILTALKIYPFFGVSAWAIYCLWNKGPRRRLGWAALFLFTSQVTTLIVVLAMLPPAHLAMAGSIGSHGLTALGYINTTLASAFGIAKARLLIRILFLTKAASFLAGLSLLPLVFRPQDLFVKTNHQKSGLAYAFTNSTLLVMTAVSIGCYITTISYDYRLVFLLPFFATVATICFGNPRLCLAKRTALISLLIGGLYIAYLPFIFHSSQFSLPFTLELLDEMVIAPFMFGSSGGMLFLLASRDLSRMDPNPSDLMA